MGMFRPFASILTTLCEGLAVSTSKQAADAGSVVVALGSAPAFRLGYRPALDGLRGIAILLVLGYHSQLRFLRGGYLGVDLFFVLSGFLITCLLVQEWRERGSVSLKGFYWRRILRLFPALFAALLVWAVWALCRHVDVWAVGEAVLVVVCYGTNIVTAFSSLKLVGFGHSWSLSAEEQFYLVWPAVLLVLLRRGWSPRRIGCLSLLAALAVNVYRACLWSGHDSWIRLYFGPDTHADPLLIGCAIGLLIQNWPVTMTRRGILTLALLFAGSILTLTYWAMNVGNEIPLPYMGGFSLVAVACGVVILGALQPGWWTTWALEFRPLVRLGRLSYSLYLWHPLAYAVFHEVTRDHSFRWSLTKLLPNLCALLLAVCSYVCVERPFLRLKDRRKTPRTPREPSPTHGAPAGRHSGRACQRRGTAHYLPLMVREPAAHKN